MKPGIPGDQDSAEGITVAAEKLGGRMHGNVRAVLKGAGECRCGKCVVDSKNGAAVMGDAQAFGQQNIQFINRISSWLYQQNIQYPIISFCFFTKIQDCMNKLIF